MPDEPEHLSLADAEAELASLDARRARLIAWITDQRRARRHVTPIAEAAPETAVAPVTNTSSQESKIAFFRALFRGRPNVFPRRFESAKTGKSGYAPVCRKEWVPGICEKPRIRCEDCTQRAFVPVSDVVVRHHLACADPADTCRDYSGVNTSSAPFSCC